MNYGMLSRAIMANPVHTGWLQQLRVLILTAEGAEALMPAKYVAANDEWEKERGVAERLHLGAPVHPQEQHIMVAALKKLVTQWKVLEKEKADTIAGECDQYDGAARSFVQRACGRTKYRPY